MSDCKACHGLGAELEYERDDDGDRIMEADWCFQCRQKLFDKTGEETDYTDFSAAMRLISDKLRAKDDAAIAMVSAFLERHIDD